jgi:hypothetical protein
LRARVRRAMVGRIPFSYLDDHLLKAAAFLQE